MNNMLMKQNVNQTSISADANVLCDAASCPIVLYTDLDPEATIMH